MLPRKKIQLSKNISVRYIVGNDNRFDYSLPRFIFPLKLKIKIKLHCQAITQLSLEEFQSLWRLKTSLIFSSVFITFVLVTQYLLFFFICYILLLLLLRCFSYLVLLTDLSFCPYQAFNFPNFSFLSLFSPDIFYR